MENREENCEMIWKIWKKSKLKCDTIWKIWKKCERMWKIWRKIVKDIKNMEKKQVEQRNDMENIEDFCVSHNYTQRDSKLIII